MMRTLAIPAACAMLVILLNGACCRADDQAVSFPKGTFTLNTYAGLMAQPTGRHEVAPSITVGVSDYLRDDFSLGVEVTGERFAQPGDDSYLGALSAVMRHHIYDRNGCTVFGDVIFSVSQASERTPDDGTYFNFNFRAGVGATLPINDRLDFMAGVRYFHLSNARLEGSDHNPSINGIEGYVGVMWKF